MSFAQDTGYTPRSFQALMESLREELNNQFNTSYTETTFLGTKWYQMFYAAAQLMLESEIKTSEIFLYLQQYIVYTNQRIQRPSVSYMGMIEAFTSYNYKVSLKPITDPDAGKIFICVDADSAAPNYPDQKLLIAGLIRDFVAGGIVSQGDQIESLTLTNGQEFDFKFYLPVVKPILLRLTLNISDNNLLTVPDDEVIRSIAFDNINARYRMGWDFEPQKYFNLSNALWASDVLLEYSFNGGSTWSSVVYESDYRDKLTFDLEDIAVIINE